MNEVFCAGVIRALEFVPIPTDPVLNSNMKTQILTLCVRKLQEEGEIILNAILC